jgi:DNA ligase-associated metallophosphoesterase
MSITVINGAELVADASGALFWPTQSTLVVADLHLEKGSGFAQRHGTLLPPYDSAETLRGLARAIDRYAPARVLCLGDSFHDRAAAGRLAPGDADILRALVRRVDWVWIAGNHDPAPPEHLGGRVAGDVAIGPLIFRHEAEPGIRPGEISGHFHPKASVATRGRRVSARCFVEDGNRMILPAFGAYTGGLDVHDPAIRQHFGRSFVAHVIGRDRVHRFASAQLG